MCGFCGKRNSWCGAAPWFCDSRRKGCARPVAGWGAQPSAPPEEARRQRVCEGRLDQTRPWRGGLVKPCRGRVGWSNHAMAGWVRQAMPWPGGFVQPCHGCVGSSNRAAMGGGGGRTWTCSSTCATATRSEGGGWRREGDSGRGGGRVEGGGVGGGGGGSGEGGESGEGRGVARCDD